MRQVLNDFGAVGFVDSEERRGDEEEFVEEGVAGWVGCECEDAGCPAAFVAGV